jgi:hypothetical protein
METISKVLIFLGILLVLSFPVSCKIFGTTDIPKLVEQDGFCKIVYGEDYDLNEKDNYCFTMKDGLIDKKVFTETEFRNVCPRVKLIEPRFYSECFYKGDSR